MQQCANVGVITPLGAYEYMCNNVHACLKVYKCGFKCIGMCRLYVNNVKYMCKCVIGYV